MFLLSKELNILNLSKEVFVSYIRRYVLTGGGVEPVQGKSLFSSPIFGDMFLLDKLSLSLSCNDKVFVSYIRRYVLTWKLDIDGLCGAIAFSSPIFGDMFLLVVAVTL